jgi:hypothetical protein
MAAQAVVFQDCRASSVNLKRNLIQTSLGRRKRGFYVLFCVLNVPWVYYSLRYGMDTISQRTLETTFDGEDRTYIYLQVPPKFLATLRGKK